VVRVTVSTASAVFNNNGLFLVETGGTWEATLPFNNLSGGTLQQIAGQFSLGTLSNSGTIKLDGGFLNTSNFVAGVSGGHRVALGGYTPGTHFGLLNAQDLALNGSLTVTLTNGLVPTNGSAFTIATDVSQSGRFASLTFPPLQSNLTWHVRYTPTAVKLQVAPPFAQTSSTRLGDGSFQFTLTGPTGGAYAILASTNLVDWVVIETNSSFPGTLIFTDPEATKFWHRFYRSQLFD
jgi:hypothetical protein